MLSASATYQLPTDMGTFSFTLNYFDKDEIFIGLSPGLENIEVAYLDGYTLWSARAGWRPNDESGLSVTLYVDNLRDEDYFGTGNIEYTNQGSRALVPARGRNYGAKIGYSF